MINLAVLRRASLARKFILLTSAMVLATALLLLLFVLATAREFTDRELLSHGLSVATILAQNSEFGIYTEDRATLDQIVASVGADPDVAYAAVLNRKGRPLVQAVKARGWTIPPPVLPSDPAGPPMHRDGTSPTNRMAYIDVVAAVVGPADAVSLDVPSPGAHGAAAPIGYVRLILSRAQLQKTQKRFLLSSMAVTGLLILIGITLTVWMTRRIVRPVRTLGDAALAFSEGLVNAPIDVRSRDEIGELARSFDTMIRRLKESHDAVEQRTGELIAANAQLQQEIAERRRVEEILRQRQQVLQSVYEMGTTLGQSFQSLCEQVAAHLAGFLNIPIVLVQQLEEGQARILAAARDEALVDADQITADAAAWGRIEEVNALCLVQGHFLEIHKGDPGQAADALKTLAAFPIKNSKGIMAGLITLLDRDFRSLEKDDIHLIEIYANYMAYAMEQRDLEVRLQSAQKTQVIAQLASGVAHEVRNPLNALLTLSEALFIDLGENTEDKEFLTQIRVQVDRLSALMQDLLELGKPIKPAQLRPEPLPPLCLQAIQLWKESHADATVRVHLVPPEDREPLTVLADHLRLQQVLINLLDNAAQHSSGEGRILMVLDRTAGAFGRIQVIDEGAGIPENVLPHVFEPFFTTRKKGTGLGMSLVRHIVENHQGTVAIWNNVPGPGCTAEVRIPLADAAGAPGAD